MKNIILIISIIFLTSCTYYNDINNLAIISEISIEYDNSYKINFKVLENDNNEKIYTESCQKLTICFNNLNNKLAKKLYLTHLDLLILKDNIKKDNINEIMNFFLNDNSSRNTFSIIMSNNIDDVLNIDSKEIINILELSNKTTGIVSNITLDKMIKEIINYKISYVPYFIEKEVNGYISIYDDNKVYTKDESIIINLIFNRIKSITLLINEEEYKIDDVISNISNKNNNLLFNISLKYEGNNKDILKEYLANNINSFIKENNLNYFYYLCDKYGIKGKFEVCSNIDIVETNINTGDYFE